MPRGQRKIPKRKIQPDSRYHDVRVAKFINYVMRKGKKSLAQRIVYRALEKASQMLNQPPLVVFEKAIENAGPLLEVRPRRIGGVTYQVPYEVPPHRRFTLGAKWIIEAARKRQGKPMEDFLAEELVAAYNNEGTAVKKKLDTHKMAEANRAFAHYARF
jgi:small subunit ribosomal protein S7